MNVKKSEHQNTQLEQQHWSRRLAVEHTRTDIDSKIGFEFAQGCTSRPPPTPILFVSFFSSLSN